MSATPALQTGKSAAAAKRTASRAAKVGQPQKKQKTTTSAATTLDEGPPTIGNGGCVAHVLKAVDVFPTVEEAKQKLNAQIPILKPKFRTDQQVPEFIGIPNDVWHPEVVKAAVVEDGRGGQSGYHFRKLDLAKVDLREEVKWGDLMIDGVLNDTYVRRRLKDDKYLHPESVVDGAVDGARLPKGYIRIRTDLTDETSAASNEASWRHAIATRNGKIVDKEIQMSATYLWLGDGNRPDADRGYFRKVYKVYRIFKCATEKAGCKGECGGFPNSKVYVPGDGLHPPAPYHPSCTPPYTEHLATSDAAAEAAEEGAAAEEAAAEEVAAEEVAAEEVAAEAIEEAAAEEAAAEEAAVKAAEEAAVKAAEEAAAEEAAVKAAEEAAAEEAVAKEAAAEYDWVQLREAMLDAESFLLPYLWRVHRFQYPALEVTGSLLGPHVSLVDLESHDPTYDDFLNKLHNWLVLHQQEHFTVLLEHADPDVHHIIKRFLCVFAVNPDLVKVILKHLQPFADEVIANNTQCDAEVKRLTSSILPVDAFDTYTARDLAFAVIATDTIIATGPHDQIHRLWWLAWPVSGLAKVASPKWRPAWFEPSDEGDLTRQKIGEWHLAPIVQQLFNSHETALTCEQWNKLFDVFLRCLIPVDIKHLKLFPTDFSDGHEDAFFYHFGVKYCLVALRHKGRCLFLSDSFQPRGETQSFTMERFVEGSAGQTMERFVEGSAGQTMERFVEGSAGQTIKRGETIELENLSNFVGMIGKHVARLPMSCIQSANLEGRFLRGCAILAVLHAFFVWDRMDALIGPKVFPKGSWCKPVWYPFYDADTDVLRLRLVAFLHGLTKTHVQGGMDALEEGMA